MTHDLQPMMDRSRQEPFFLGYVLDRYAKRHALDDEQLVRRLKCDLNRLPHLFICRRPRQDDGEFSRHVADIAAYVPCHEQTLLSILREMDS